jgi:hypothetical protein
MKLFQPRIGTGETRIKRACRLLSSVFDRCPSVANIWSLEDALMVRREVVPGILFLEIATRKSADYQQGGEHPTKLHGAIFGNHAPFVT